MAQAKNDMFQDEDRTLAELARALSHPARIAILKTLAQRNTCICGEIVEVLPLAQSTVSQHLRELKKAGLIHGDIEGPRSCYCINYDKIQKLSEIFNGLLAILGLPDSAQCCGDKQ